MRVFGYEVKGGGKEGGVCEDIELESTKGSLDCSCENEQQMLSPDVDILASRMHQYLNGAGEALPAYVLAPSKDRVVERCGACVCARTLLLV